MRTYYTHAAVDLLAVAHSVQRLMQARNACNMLQICYKCVTFAGGVADGALQGAAAGAGSHPAAANAAGGAVGGGGRHGRHGSSTQQGAPAARRRHRRVAGAAERAGAGLRPKVRRGLMFSGLKEQYELAFM